MQPRILVLICHNKRVRGDHGHVHDYRLQRGKRVRWRGCPASYLFMQPWVLFLVDDNQRLRW